jgi:RHH-type proline utilization regulon transcriptional repressor/proline dehydrogenase/delta 1-pyrroline-5-carboxylate dehydrogenase
MAAFDLESPAAFSASHDLVRRCLSEPEATAIDRMIAQAAMPPALRGRIAHDAAGLISAVRQARGKESAIEALMREYDLRSDEGIVLMCLAEALLRIPDDETRDKLIRDKIGPADWAYHLGHSPSPFVNASTWALAITGKALRLTDGQAIWAKLAVRLGEPILRDALLGAMRLLGHQFVMGETIQKALKRAGAAEKAGARHSYDMLGEAARTAADADRYFEAYRTAIRAIGSASNGRGPVAGPGISIKLSALHPRYEPRQRRRALTELQPRLLSLAEQAAAADMGLTIDAEEADRLELSIELLESLLGTPSLAGWDGLGLAVQAYQTRALPLIDLIAERAKLHGRRLMVRLVKGAYWDSEVKRAQEAGLERYPVFTRKAATDASYLAAAKRILAAGNSIFGQFATHNAYTVAAIHAFADGRTDFEFQRLHGMGAQLYERVSGPGGWGIPCRIYAPVGTHRDLLAYLVRRLIENGANSSFVNRLADETIPIEKLVEDPIARAQASKAEPRAIPRPREIYGAERLAARGVDFGDPLAVAGLERALNAEPASCDAAPIISGCSVPGMSRTVFEPADRTARVGAVIDATPADVGRALEIAAGAREAWDAVPVSERAARLEKAADLLEADMPGFVALIVREAGRAIPDAVSEVREAVDFCRYYAVEARRTLAGRDLPGPTGESNRLDHHGRGIFAAISPWNFPLSIFTGQITAALVAGNAVMAKPAEQTPLIGARMIRLLHAAGIPPDILALLPGPGEAIGAALVADPRVTGVVFTGSTDVARAISRSLAARDGPIATLIAETGGQNAMIVDSSALIEQAVADAVASAFNSAGQRCSALRVMFVQDEIAALMIEMLAGAIQELRVGDPKRLDTDIGPVIDDDARKALIQHADRMDRDARLIAVAPLTEDTSRGTFFAPRLYEIDSLARLQREVFGPILHVVRYAGGRLDAVIDQINATGYGLTLGVQSRIDETIEQVRRRARVGNLYVNRTIIGATVETQPFGGEGLSGTGPKAGGPHYLPRFAVERTFTVNTAAAGGNATLMAEIED